MNISKDNLAQKYNDILKNHIGFGKWQLCIFFSLYFIMNSPFVFYPAFPLTIVPPHRCKIDQLDGKNVSQNLTFYQIARLAVPSKVNKNDPPMIGQEFYPCQQFNSTWINYIADKLKFYDYNETVNSFDQQSKSLLNSATSCQNGYAFDHTSRPEFEGTAVEYFELVCDRSHFIPLSTTLFMLGQMASCVFNGYLSDKYGRRKVILICAVFVYISSFCVSFAPNIIIFILLRTILGFTIMGAWNSGWVLIAETATERQRNAIMAIMFISFSFVFFGFYVASAYLLQSWRWLHMALTIFAAPSVILYIFLPESPRWLLVNNRTKDFVKELNKAISMNKGNKSGLGPEQQQEPQQIELNPESQQKSKLDDYKSSFHFFKHELKEIFVLVRVPILRKQSIIVFYQWFMIGMVFFGLILNSVTLKGNPYLTIWLLSLGSIPAALMQFLLYDRFGRRAPFQISLSIAAVMLIGSSLYQYFGIESEYDVVLIIAVLIGKCMIDSTYSMAYIWTAELYPTQVRNYALGICSALKSIGYAIAPYIVQLGESLWRPLPLLIFGCMAFISVIFNLALSETKNRSLFDTVDEMVNKSKIEGTLNSNYDAPQDFTTDL